MSDDPMPTKLQQCIDSWKKYLPDYKIVKWDLKRFPLDKSKWVKQAYERKKYAFAADYIRLYALATEGGIYFDSDVEVIKSFDSLLEFPYFICKENSPQGIEAATIGAEPGTDWIVKCLDYYEDKQFVDETGKVNDEVLPRVLLNKIASIYKINYIQSLENFVFDNDTVCVLPVDYFSPKNYVSKKIQITENTYSIHHFAGSWQPLWKKILLYAWVPFTVAFPSCSKSIKRIVQ